MPVKKFINREISWLRFNERVLRESQNEQLPIMEQLRYFAIADHNLDEFFMVRYASIAAQRNKKLYGEKNSKQELQEIKKELYKLIRLQTTLLKQCLKRCKKKHYAIISKNQLSKMDLEHLLHYFKEHIFPSLKHMILDADCSFPFLPNKSLFIIFQLKCEKEKKQKHAILVLPQNLPRFHLLNWHTKKRVYIPLEEIIYVFAKEIFSCDTIIKHSLIRIIRDGSIEYSHQEDDLMQTSQNLLKKRKHGDIIHLRYQNFLDEDVISFLEHEINIHRENFIESPYFLALDDFQEIIDQAHEEDLHSSITPRWPNRLTLHDQNCFQMIRQKDFLVHHPFEDFRVVTHFLHQAAHDPCVVAIKQTLYRTSPKSPIIEALIAAAKNGKSVTVLIELKARFDEEANIKWAQDLEKQGVHVVYGFINIKIHAKLSIIIRKEENNLQTYVHFGTGNYHPINATLYTDISLFTCNKNLTRDAISVFNYMVEHKKPKKLTSLHVAPFNLRKLLRDSIIRETRHAQNHETAWIIIKVNHLVDKKIIALLYKASQAGVHITLIVRGICCLRPHIKNISDNIRVISIVGRFLEHSRIFAFANRAEKFDTKADIYISSADLMERNFNERIEIAVPIYHETMKEQLLKEILYHYSIDQKNCWVLCKNTHYKKIVNDDKGECFSAHDYFMTHRSLSGTGKILRIS